MALTITPDILLSFLLVGGHSFMRTRDVRQQDQETKKVWRPELLFSFMNERIETHVDFVNLHLYIEWHLKALQYAADHQSFLIPSRFHPLLSWPWVRHGDMGDNVRPWWRILSLEISTTHENGQWQMIHGRRIQEVS